MAKGKYTILIEKEGTYYKLCKIWFGSDGSYYVTVPYHPSNKAILVKQTLNYDTSTPASIEYDNVKPLEEALDVASADDKRIKLAHHPDGLVQFSGQGVLSGRNTNGTIKGIGVQSWPLRQGCRGPAFCLMIHGVEEFEQETGLSDSVCLFRDTDITPIPGADSLFLEGHYFPSLWHRFIQRSPEGAKIIPIVHPTGSVISLKVLLAPNECPIGSFFGLEMFTFRGGVFGASSRYSLSGSTGNIRKNEKGETLGDGVCCFYPRPEEIPIRRNVDYPPLQPS